MIAISQSYIALGYCYMRGFFHVRYSKVVPITFFMVFGELLFFPGNKYTGCSSISLPNEIGW